jgi:hypothetical protein
MKILMILVVALVSSIAADAVAQTGTCTPATRAYWPTFGGILGGPYVYVPPLEGSCHQIRRAAANRGRRSRVYMYR